MSDTKEFLGSDYKIPTVDKYMKFQKGENRFRILDKPLLGFEYWTEEGETKTPHRVRMDETLPASADKPKHFWAMIVWNYEAKKIQVLQVTQKGIQKAIQDYSTNKSWGAPYDYDLVVNREGDGFDTEYTVMALPKEELSEDIKLSFNNTRISLEALFTNDDPFQSSQEEPEKEDPFEGMDEVKEKREKAKEKAFEKLEDKGNKIPTDDLLF